MKSVFIAVLAGLCCFQCTMPWRHALSGDATSDTFLFDKSIFDNRVFLARAFAEDDRAAWWSSDSISSHPPLLIDSLDDTWFVLEREGSRQIYYGRFSPLTSRYSPKYAFRLTEDRTIVVVPPETDSLVNLFAHAVYTGNRHFNHVLDSLMLDFKFNHYVRQNPDGSFALWYFPAGMGNYCGYGIEITLLISPTADSIMQTTITGNEFKYFELSDSLSALTLDNTFDDVPSVSNIFFTLMNIRYFSRISLINRHSVSTAFKSKFFPDDLYWEHTAK